MSFLERDFSDVPGIAEYYKDKTIFVTGGSGFMGKVLIEKLLYSCGDLDRIYLLLRNRKGVKAEDRLKNLYTSRCFDRLRKEKPDIFEKKVFFIAGDASELGLGISDEDRTLIINRANIIFHVAASVRFDESLKTACRLNLRGTREAIELAKEVRNLEAFVHVSTSYVNTNRKCLDEIVYPAFADWRETLEIVENVDDHTLKVLTPKFLGQSPNTYVFTKQLAEHVINEQKGKLPIVITRPSIVVSSVSEPMVGWIENLNGPVGIMIASGKGVLRVMYTDPDLVSDYMPVDIAIKTFIAAAWARGTKKLEPTDDLHMYNCSASEIKSLTMGQIVKFGKDVSHNVPLDNVIWAPGGQLTSSRLVYYFKMYLLQLLPALIIDSILKISGNKPMLIKLQRRIFTANKALEYYVTQQWSFKNENIIKLRSKIQKQDNKHFYYEMENIDVQEYFLNSCLAGKLYILKEKMEDVPKAKAHFKRMKILDFIVTTTFRLGFLWLIVNTSYFQSILNFFYSVIIG